MRNFFEFSETPLIELSYGLKFSGTFFDAAGITVGGSIWRSALAMDDFYFVQQVLSGNQDAFKFLVLRYQRPLFRFLAAFGLSETAVDDLAQDTFLKAYKSLNVYDPKKSSFSSWLFTIAKNSALNEKAKLKVRNRLSSTIPALDELSTTNQHSEYAVKETGLRIRNALQKIPLKFRSALALSYLQEMSLEEIAKIESCSVGTVKSRIFRGKEMMRMLIVEKESYK
jgi:RNA polymerase sigma-70 factor (ECF subfamily)